MPYGVTRPQCFKLKSPLCVNSLWYMKRGSLWPSLEQLWYLCLYLYCYKCQQLSYSSAHRVSINVLRVDKNFWMGLIDIHLSQCAMTAAMTTKFFFQIQIKPMKYCPWQDWIVTKYISYVDKYGTLFKWRNYCSHAPLLFIVVLGIIEWHGPHNAITGRWPYLRLGVMPGFI